MKEIEWNDALHVWYRSCQSQTEACEKRFHPFHYQIIWLIF